jgi:hypothetical protein
MEGLRRARALGKHLGRRKALTPREAVELRARHQAGWTLKAPMGAYGLSQASVCRYLAQASLVDTEAADEPGGEATLEAPGVYFLLGTKRTPLICPQWRIRRHHHGLS